MKDKWKPCTEFPQHCHQNDLRISRREHTSPLLRSFYGFHLTQSKSPNLSNGLGPAPSPTSALPSLPPTHSQLFPCSHQACCHLHAAVPTVPSPGFQWALPSLISGLCSDVTSTVRTSLTTLHETVTHILSLPQSHQHCLSPFADLFHCIATYYRWPALR